MMLSQEQRHDANWIHMLTRVWVAQIFVLTNTQANTYSDEYKPIIDVPIVNASTAYTDSETGETLILHFNQVLWYGKNMQVSLINPNQMRHNGWMVSDDPTDNNRTFGITGDDVVIPFEIMGTTIFFTSHVPTRWELANCRVF
jgi:hypothetical protein